MAFNHKDIDRDDENEIIKDNVNKRRKLRANDLTYHIILTMCGNSILLILVFLINAII